LHSHTEKLIENQMTFKRIRFPSIVPTMHSAGWHDALARAREMDGFKQAGFYVSFDATGAAAPDEKFDESRTKDVLQLARLSFEVSDILGQEFDAKRHEH
jgi:AbiV family abortive infection protein